MRAVTGATERLPSIFGADKSKANTYTYIDWRAVLVANAYFLGTAEGELPPNVVLLGLYEAGLTVAEALARIQIGPIGGKDNEEGHYDAE